MRAVVIMGAGGRDFHNYNTVFRNDPDTRVVAFTATQIPGIAGRTYPPALEAVRSGHWPLYRYHPEAERPFQLDSKPATVPLREFAGSEARFAMLARTAPEEFERLMDLAEADTRERWRYYQQLAGLSRVAPDLPTLPVVASGPAEEDAP